MILIFGPAGSGKSEQGLAIAKKYGWKWLSVGQLLREQNDPKMDAILEAGELVDDVFVTELMRREYMRAEADGEEVILDGYPRNEAQAKLMMENGDAKLVDGVIVLDVPPSELWNRIEKRGRSDDTKEAVDKRWNIFEQNICSILPLLEGENVKITTVDGVGTIEEITERIEEVLKEWDVLTEADVLHSEIGGKSTEKSYGE